MTLRHLPVLLGLLALPAFGNDLFTGTVEQHGTQLIMTRCDAVKSRYLLLEQDKGKISVLQPLRQRPAAEGKLTVAVFAKYISHNGGNALMVDSIRSLQPGQSCHLDDLFG